ncbi:MAG: helix-turn-helix domain-containing protein [Putridiphycobacter sp.]
MKFVYFIVFVVVSGISCIASTDSTDFKTFYYSNDDLGSFDYIKYYTTNFETKKIDTLMAYNALFLKEEDPKDFITHEFARVFYYKQTFRLDTALILIDGLSGNKTIQDDPKLKGNFETIYGIICYDLERPLDARSHYLNGLNIYSSIDDSVGVKGNLINVGSTYFLEERYDSAEFYFESAKIFEDQGIMAFHQNLYNNLATVYQNTNRFDQSIKYYLALIQEGNGQNSTHYYNLGLVYFKNGNFEESVDYLEKATTIKFDESNIFRSSVYNALSQSQKKIGLVDEAYQSLLIADSLKLEEDKESANRLLDELKLNHQAKLFEKEKKLSEEKLRTKKIQNWFLIMLIVFITIIFFVIVVVIALKNKKNKQLLKQNIELTKTHQKKSSKEVGAVNNELITALEKMMVEKEAYTNPKLTLDKLAKQLNTNRTYLSESINAFYNLSFSALINKYRINKAREMLIDHKFEHYSIEGIATSVGYNSISTFNASFKKETGITPSYFRKNATKKA